ncbi:hypothetical protein PHMEG_00027418 [Phytophthora megakarya]|uniref:Uncharacterized protein n=1 Tax=Phytophthora megakarya TaxID=4795 RepID=A0A225V795_9STRA|nr:hypothetical protein PHMEG_00027418 [Phytophthora megakarya]
MRSLSFLARSNDKCSQNSEYFKIETPPPIVQLPGGSRALLNALILTKKLIQPFLTISDHRDAVLVPLVCPLTSQECPTMSSKAAITRAMNNIFTGAGSRFFYKFKPGSKHPYCDEIEDHWTAINGSSCHFCNELTGPGALRSKRAMTQNYCARLYRPLKTAMELNLQHVRFVRQRRISRRDRHLQFRQYKCLVAGVTEDGVLCGLYFRKGYNYFW